jgi:hypothetical protein
MADETSDQPDKPEPKPVTIGELRRRAICKKRYGRATLTISRWGRLIGKSELAEKIEAFRAAKESAQEVAWAFVQARVKEHSPTFSWEEADRLRLLGLVVDCSEDPQFESAEPEAVARTLVAAQDREKEELREFAQMFSRTFANTTNLKSILPSSYLGWAEQQRRSFEAIQRSFGVSQIMEQMAGLSKAVGVVQQIGGLGALGQMARQMEEQQRMLARAAMPLQAPMLGAAFNLRNSPLFELSRSLQQTMEALDVRPMKLRPNILLNRPELTFGEVFGAAESAAEVMAERGARRQASELRAVTGEAREVTERPSLERVQEMVTDLSKRFEEESKRQVDDEDEKLVLELFLFFLQILFALFLYLIGIPPRRMRRRRELRSRPPRSLRKPAAPACS